MSVAAKFTAAMFCLVYACSADQPVDAARGTTVRDSAGIRIVDSRSPGWHETNGWRISDTPSVSIGTLDGAREYQLTNVRAVVELSDGRIVVANAGTMDVRCYSADGRFLWASGRRGRGPGDYSTLSSVSRYRGDSLLIHDFGLAQVVRHRLERPFRTILGPAAAR